MSASIPASLPWPWRQTTLYRLPHGSRLVKGGQRNEELRTEAQKLATKRRRTKKHQLSPKGTLASKWGFGN